MAIDYTPFANRAGIMVCKVNLLTGEEYLIGWDAGPNAEVFTDFTPAGPWRYEIRMFMGQSSEAAQCVYDGTISISILGAKR